MFEVELKGFMREVGDAAISTIETWNDVVHAVANGGTVVLPDHEIEQTSALLIEKPVSIVGSGQSSKLKLIQDVEINGSRNQIHIANTWNVRLAGFAIEHDRHKVERTLAISIGDFVKYVDIADMLFTGITSDCVIVRPDSGERIGAVNIAMHDCTVDGWWESVFNVHTSGVQHCMVYNNLCETSSAHPDASVSKPYGMTIQSEYSLAGGVLDGIVCANNVFDAHKADPATMTNSLGVVIGCQGPPFNIRNSNIAILNNRILGFYWGVSVPWINGDPKVPAHVNIQGNYISDGASYPINVWPWAGGKIEGPWTGAMKGHGDDVLSIIGNECVSNLAGPQIDLTNAPGLNVIQAANSYHT